MEAEKETHDSTPFNGSEGERVSKQVKQSVLFQAFLFGLGFDFGFGFFFGLTSHS